MRMSQPNNRSQARAILPSARHHRGVTDGALRDLLDPLEQLARGSTQFFTAHQRWDDALGIEHILPRFLFVGPGSRGNYLRVGIFAGIHGDETAGVHAALQMLRRLHDDPAPALGYELFVFPVCNTWGFQHGSRFAASGADLNREFWRGSNEPEVVSLERQIRQLQFDGLLSLHADDTSSGIYGFAKGHQLTRHVLEPALEAAAKILPRNFDKSIDNFEANNGIILKGYEGVLGAPPEQHPKPFEIVFETPQNSSFEPQIEANIEATFAVLKHFRTLISEAQNI